MLRPMSLPTYRAAAAIPPRAGIGLKLEHAPDISSDALGVGFFEVHAENFMGDGGPPQGQAFSRSPQSQQKQPPQAIH